MKKKFALCMAMTLGISMAITGCGSVSVVASVPTSQESNEVTDLGTAQKLTIWASGSDNVRIQLQAQVDNFNSIQSDYEAELQFITSGTGAQGLSDRIVAAIQAGQTDTDYDLVELGESEIDTYLELGGDDVFLPIDHTELSNYSNLTATSTYRNDICIPYRGTTVGIAYNADTVTEVPETADELYQWIEDHPQRFAYNTPDSGGAGGSFVLTAVYDFLPDEALTSSDASYEEQWDQGFDLLTELHPYLYKSSGKVVYPNKNQGTLDLLANGEVDMIPAWADQVLTQKKEGTLPDSIKFTQISPALTGSTVGFSIPEIGSNEEGALAFIDYMLTPDAQNIALEEQAAIPVIDFSLLDQTQVTTISDLDVSSFRLSSIGDLSTDLNERWSSEIGTLQ